MSADDELADLAAQLGDIAEVLADIAIDQLRAATDPDDPDPKGAEALERRVTRARRAVERAVAILDNGTAAEDP
jgi:hypothetical protein